MKENVSAELALSDESQNITIFGYELIREDLISDLLGKNTPEILYWAGKRLARKYPLNTLDETIEFFSKASWGVLTIKSENKDEMDFELSSPLTMPPDKSKAEHFFQLEAGFLAQQIENQKDAVAEAFEHPIKRSQKVLITVKWDQKDHV